MRPFESHDADSGRLGDQSARDVPLDDVPFEQIAASVPAPDFTDRVMQRLGYERCAHEEAARRRRRRFASRAFVSLMFMAAIGIGVYMHGLSDRARRPIKDAVPGAVQIDLHRASDRLQSIGSELRPLLAEPSFTPAQRPEGERARQAIDRQSTVWWSGVL